MPPDTNRGNCQHYPLSKSSLPRRIDPALFLDFTRSFEGFLTRCEVTLPAESIPESIPQPSAASASVHVEPYGPAVWAAA